MEQLLGVILLVIAEVGVSYVIDCVQDKDIVAVCTHQIDCLKYIHGNPNYIHG